MHRWIAAAAASGMLLAGCGSDDDEPAVAKVTPAAAKATYAPTSDVGSNGAIGKDVAAIRALLEPEGADAKPDFAAAEKIWSKGQNSTKSDGTNRTLAEWVDKQPAGKGVADALAGSGGAAGLSDEQRVELVDKGMTVSLKSHSLEEFDGAKEKLAAGELDPEEGAIHNVDEVWAYFHAEGHGVGATAAKRSKDFGLDEHSLGNDVIAGIKAARAAVTAKDAAALAAAAERTRGAMNKIFALAVKKYAAEGENDAKARAEGLAFSWGLAGQLDDADLKSIQGAFAARAAPAGAAGSVADTLDAAASKLGFTGPLPAYPAS
ncbi:MAG: hypothetical protein H0W96_15685 [Solirubrobacterales bacterium]|nr:hypothetical protein [Solirubrobacterales bacterium]